jgi:hypothetical protein
MHLDVYKFQGRWHAEVRQDGRVMWAQAFRVWAVALEVGLDTLGTWTRT